MARREVSNVSQFAGAPPPALVYKRATLGLEGENAEIELARAQPPTRGAMPRGHADIALTLLVSELVHALVR